MLAHELDYDRVSYPVAVESKLDGLRVTHVDGAGYTRNGRTYETWAPFSRLLSDIVPVGVHVDSEICARNWNETSKLLKRIKNVDVDTIREQVTCHLFDAFDSSTVGTEPFADRRRGVEWVAERAKMSGYHFEITPLIIANDRSELDAAFTAARHAGAEGIMVKALSGVYVLKRSRDWMKRKAWKDITVTIVGATHGWSLCPSCMTADIRERRSVEETPTRHPDDVKPDPECPTCAGAAKGVPRLDILGSFQCVDDKGNAWDVGMGFTAADKLDFMARAAEMKGRKIDVKIQEDDAGANAIVARHAVYLRVREDV